MAPSLPFHSGTKLTKASAAWLGSSMMSFFPRSAALTNLLTSSGFSLSTWSETPIACAMCGKNSSLGMTFTFTPAACTGGIQSGTPAMPADLPVATNSHTPLGPVVRREPCAREQAEQRIVGGVLERHHRDRLALQVGGLGNAGILAHHQLHKAVAAEHGDDLDRHAVLPDHDRPVGDDTAERRIAGTHLLGH